MSDRRHRRIVLLDPDREYLLGNARELLDAEWVGVSDDDCLLCEDLSDVDLVVASDEYRDIWSARICAFRERGVPTLHIADGIVEWRNTWENPRSLSEDAGLPLFQPILADKVACLGCSQARVFESWGNGGKCEVVGAPRFDGMLAQRVRDVRNGGEFRVLVMTARTPFFTEVQREGVVRSLLDLKEALAVAEPLGEGRRVRPVWRVAESVAESVGLGQKEQANEYSGKELAVALRGVDAVVTTPSTALLEGMLSGLPVASLDYTGSFHYVPAAWTMRCSGDMPRVLRDLASSPPARMLTQDYLLHDALACRSPASPRLAQLMAEMIRIGREARAAGASPQFPSRILAVEGHAQTEREARLDLPKLHPSHPVFSQHRVECLQAELGHLKLLVRGLARRGLGRAVNTDEGIREMQQLLRELRGNARVGRRVLSNPVVRAYLGLKRWFSRSHH